MPNSYYTYITSNQTNSTIYVGVTVHIERYTEIKDAIQREKLLKGWKREKKNNLTNQMNPQWNDLMKD